MRNLKEEDKFKMTDEQYDKRTGTLRDYLRNNPEVSLPHPHSLTHSLTHTLSHTTTMINPIHFVYLAVMFRLPPSCEPNKEEPSHVRKTRARKKPRQLRLVAVVRCG